MAERIGGIPRNVIGLVMLILLSIGIIAYLSPEVIHPMFLGILIFSILTIYLATEVLVTRGIIPEDYVWFFPIFVIAFSLILAGLGEAGYLPMLSLFNVAVLDVISTTMLYALVIAGIVGVLVYLVVTSRR